MFPVQFISAVVAIFTAIIGFYVTTVVEELRSGTTVIYSVVRDDDNAVLTIKNVSREGTLSNLHVGMTCVENDLEPCFQTPSDTAKPFITMFAPIQGSGEILPALSVAIELKATLVAGAKLQVEMPYNVGNTSDLLFIFSPRISNGDTDEANVTLLDAIMNALEEPSRPQDIPTFLKGSSVTAIFVEYYFAFMAMAMVVTSILLGISLSWWAIYSILAFQKPREKPNDDVQKLVVDLSLSCRDSGG